MSDQYEERYRVLLETVPHLVWQMKPNAEVETVSRQWEAYTGDKLIQNALGSRWENAIHPDDLAPLAQAIEEAKTQRSPIKILHRIRRADGVYRWNLGQGHPLVDQTTGEFKGWIGTTTDVHEQKLAEDALKDSEAQFKALADAVPGGIWIADAQGAVLYQNQRFWDYAGRSPHEAEGWKWQDLPIVHPDDLPRTIETWKAAIVRGDHFEAQYRLRRYDGEYRWFLCRAFPYHDQSGKIVRWYGTNTDVHDQKLLAHELSDTEKELEEKSRLLETVLQHIPTALVYAEAPIGKLIFANDQLKKIWRREFVAVDEIADYDEYTGFHPDGRKLESQEWPLARAISTGQIINGEDIEVLLGDGTRGILRFNAAPVRNREGEIIGGVVTCEDVTEQVRSREIVAKAKANLEVERQNFERLFEQSSGFVAIFIGPDFVYGYSNATNNRLIGFDPTGKALRDVVPDVERSGLFTQLQRVYRTGQQEVVHELPLEVDSQLRYFNSTYVAHKNRHGEIDGVMAWGVDVTSQVSARKELEQSELKYREAQQMAEAANAAKSNFLANMSHEIRTPIGVIQGFADLLAERKLDPEETRWVETIQRNTRQLTSLIGEILDLAKVEADQLEVERVPFFLGDVVDDLRASLSLKAEEKGLALVVELEPDLPKVVQSDSTRLRQILINLIGNAIKFTQQGSIRVHFGRSQEKDEKLVVTVNDTGIGLTQAQQEKIFDPFVQADSSMTRRFGGTGLGLSISRKLANALGGSLELVRSEYGAGSTFQLTVCCLKEYRKDLETKTAAASGGESTGLRGRKILLVDDSPDNRWLLSHMLTQTGATVVCEANGRLGAERALSEDFDIVLMDIQMPVMDGYAATKLLHEAGFAKPVIALTAHALKEERERAMKLGFAAYLTKPIAKSVLETTIVRLLSR